MATTEAQQTVEISIRLANGSAWTVHLAGALLILDTGCMYQGKWVMGT